jgi:hypothetical protein
MFCIVNDLLGLVEDVGQVAATAVLAVVHGSHEDTGTALEKNVSKCSSVLKMFNLDLRSQRGTRGADAQSCRHRQPCST